MGVSYFAVCFAKTLAKYLQNVKYDKCIAGQTETLLVRHYALDVAAHRFAGVKMERLCCEQRCYIFLRDMD